MSKSRSRSRRSRKRKRSRSRSRQRRRRLKGRRKKLDDLMNQYQKVARRRPAHWQGSTKTILLKKLKQIDNENKALKQYVMAVQDAVVKSTMTPRKQSADREWWDVGAKAATGPNPSDAGREWWDVGAKAATGPNPSIQAMDRDAGQWAMTPNPTSLGEPALPRAAGVNATPSTPTSWNSLEPQVSSDDDVPKCPSGRRLCTSGINKGMCVLSRRMQWPKPWYTRCMAKAKDGSAKYKGVEPSVRRSKSRRSPPRRKPRGG